MKHFKFLLVFGLLVSIASCSDDDDTTPEIVNEEEVITTITVSLTPVGDSTPIVFRSQDLDGDGPNDAMVTFGTLTANTTYLGTVELLNELEDPAEDITEEVALEDDEHQMFYTPINGAESSIMVMYTDADDDGNPIGLTFSLTTGDAATGNLSVVLRHLLDKNASGVAEGDITNAGGDTDIEVSFPITIQ